MSRVRMGILRRLRAGVNKKTGSRGPREMGKLRARGWLVLGLAGLAAGCSREDTERLARIGKYVGAHAEAFSADWREGVGDSWHGSLQARVAARLRWDKGLEGLAIRVRAAGGTVELKGTVQHPGQRQRAVELAQTTAGVEKVTDLIRLGGP
jgi:hypothetical protein